MKNRNLGMFIISCAAVLLCSVSCVTVNEPDVQQCLVCAPGKCPTFDDVSDIIKSADQHDGVWEWDNPSGLYPGKVSFDSVIQTGRAKDTIPYFLGFVTFDKRDIYLDFTDIKRMRLQVYVLNSADLENENEDYCPNSYTGVYVSFACQNDQDVESLVNCTCDASGNCSPAGCKLPTPCTTSSQYSPFQLKDSGAGWFYLDVYPGDEFSQNLKEYMDSDQNYIKLTVFPACYPFTPAYSSGHELLIEDGGVHGGTGNYPRILLW